MDYYFHHIPGRLRVKSRLLKKNRTLVGRAERLLQSLGGVNSVTPNLVTGSIVIQYDPRVTTSEDILHALSRAGYFDLARTLTNDEVIHHALKRAGKALGSLLFGALIKDELEGSALSLIAEWI